MLRFLVWSLLALPSACDGIFDYADEARTKGANVPLSCPPGLCEPLLDALDLGSARVPASHLDGIVAARERLGLEVGDDVQARPAWVSERANVVTKDGRDTVRRPRIEEPRSVRRKTSRPGTASTILLMSFVGATLLTAARACSGPAWDARVRPKAADGRGEYARVGLDEGTAGRSEFGAARAKPANDRQETGWGRRRSLGASERDQGEESFSDGDGQGWIIRATDGVAVRVRSTRGRRDTGVVLSDPSTWNQDL
jgi:hypothetical protein